MSSVSRLLTTHAGSLPRPDALLELYAAGGGGEDVGHALSEAVADVVRQQCTAGIDIVGDGEFGKPTESSGEGYGHGTWLRYIRARLGGCGWAEVKDVAPISRDRRDFPEYYRASTPDADPASGSVGPQKVWACVGPIEYLGAAAVARDITTLQAALGGVPVEDAFLPVASAASIALLIPNAFYQSDEEYLVALGEAMRQEVKAIVEAGLSVQIDDPVVVGNWDYWPEEDLDGYRRYARRRVELLNDALRGVPPERIRYHVCWGSWQGPHSTDLPLRDVVDILLDVHASGLCLECANARHEHEWRVWEDTELPAGMVLIPGVVSHKTSVLEHPELVADRLIRYARCVGRENIVAGTDCGLGGRLSSDLVWAKLAALSQGAQLASQRLWPR